MNQQDAEARIKQMIRLIEQEAKEKASMVIEEAKQKMERERNKIYNAQREKVLQELKEKEENDRVQKRLEKSRKINGTRLEVQSHRNALLDELKVVVKDKLTQKMTDRASYKEFMTKLAVQGLIRFIEKDVKMMVRKEDLDIAREIVPEAVNQYKAFMKDNIGKDYDLKLEVVENSFLTEEDLGGLNLYCDSFRIVFNNTLKMRMELAFSESIPDIRKNLFPSLDVKPEYKNEKKK